MTNWLFTWVYCASSRTLLHLGLVSDSQVPSMSYLRYIVKIWANKQWSQQSASGHACLWIPAVGLYLRERGPKLAGSDSIPNLALAHLQHKDLVIILYCLEECSHYSWLNLNITIFLLVYLFSGQKSMVVGSSQSDRKRELIVWFIRKKMHNWVLDLQLKNSVSVSPCAFWFHYWFWYVLCNCLCSKQLALLYKKSRLLGTLRTQWSWQKYCLNHCARTCCSLRIVTRCRFTNWRIRCERGGRNFHFLSINLISFRRSRGIVLVKPRVFRSRSNQHRHRQRHWQSASSLGRCLWLARLVSVWKAPPGDVTARSE